jgi:4-carboxymuconolactone decarboxylase
VARWWASYGQTSAWFPRLSDSEVPPPAPDGAERERLLNVSAALATRDSSVIGEALSLALHSVERDRVEEVILQAHLFIGFPDAMNALARWREIAGPHDAQPSDNGSEAWEARGEAVCARVYGSNYLRLRRNVVALHPDLDRWMISGGYGRVIGRPGLDLVTRELCAVALLVVWGAPRQLHSHLRGAVNVGATIPEVDEAVRLACGFLDPLAAEGVRALWNRIGGSASGVAETARVAVERKGPA